MSVVVSLPRNSSSAQTPAPAESVAKAQSAAQDAYQRLLMERSNGVNIGQVLLSQVPAPRQIPIAVPVNPSPVPVGMAWNLPPGANYPTATAVSAAANAIPTTATMVTRAPLPAIAVAAAQPRTPLMRQRSTMQPMSVPQMGFQQVPAMAAPVPAQLQRTQTFDKAAPVPAQPPSNLTAGIPDPSSIDRQTLQHAKTILDRLQADTAVLTQQNQVRKQMLARYGEQQKAQNAAQVDNELQKEALGCEQRGNAQLLQVQQAILAQTMALEQQAAGLTLRYQCQVVEEGRLQKDYSLRQDFYDAEIKIAGKMQRIGRGEWDPV